jgi:hypothetical protein
MPPLSVALRGCARSINIQSPTEFASQQLNADTWRDETLRTVRLHKRTRERRSRLALALTRTSHARAHVTRALAASARRHTPCRSVADAMFLGAM